MTQPADKHEKLADIIYMINASDISSIKSVVSSIIQIINDPKSTAKDLEEVIQVDPPLTAKLLRLANSAYYSHRAQISEIRQAIIWVGYDAIKELTLSQKVCEIFKNDITFGDYSRRALWKHSLAVALFAKMIYRREFGERGENIYAAGLLHDMGLIVEDQFCQDRFRFALFRAKKTGKNLRELEREAFGFDHAEIGRTIAEDWDLPLELGAAMGNHHGPDNADHAFSRIAQTLYVADHYCQKKSIGYGDAPFEGDTLFNRCLNKLNLECLALDLIMKDVTEEMSKMEEQGFFE